jgi:hypothetical protein
VAFNPDTVGHGSRRIEVQKRPEWAGSSALIFELLLQSGTYLDEAIYTTQDGFDVVVAPAVNSSAGGRPSFGCPFGATPPLDVSLDNPVRR